MELSDALDVGPGQALASPALLLHPWVHDPLHWHHGPMGRHEVPPRTELSSQARLSGELRP